MATHELSGDELDEYLMQPDCPQCGSDNVVCTSSYDDGLGHTVRQYLCRVCGHVWTETSQA